MYEHQKPDKLSWIIFILLSLIWGSSFILMKKGMEALSSNQVAAFRIFSAFLFVVPLMFTHIKSDLFKHWKAFVAMGVFGNLIPAFLFTKAETQISSALAGMLNALTPVFTVIVGVLFFSVAVTLNKISGVIVGCLGAAGLMAFGSREENIFRNIEFGLYIVIATFFYGISVNVIRKYLSGVNSITASVYSLMFTGPVAGVYLFCTDFVTVMNTHELAWSSLGYTAVLGVIGTAVSIMIYNVMIKQAGVIFSASVTYVIPLVAIAWGILYGEYINGFQFLFVGVILTGIYLINKK